MIKIQLRYAVITANCHHRVRICWQSCAGSEVSGYFVPDEDSIPLFRFHILNASND